MMIGLRYEGSVCRVLQAGKDAGYADRGGASLRSVLVPARLEKPFGCGAIARLSIDAGVRRTWYDKY